MKVVYRGVEVEVKRGNIVEEEVEAIVNPANSYMIMGGGVAGAIKKAGGDVIEKEARKYAPVPIGKAVATTAGKLRAKFVIHAPTMEKPGPTTIENVRLATLAALKCADDVKAASIAFPGMGTGVGGLSPSESALAVVKAVKEHVDGGTSIKRIVFVGLGEDVFEAYKEALKLL
ncbi:MAG: macro domain-containing protein [Candidatus Methanomethylicota archaeon]|uniref:Macro domain-containing protein n=1 Tax=Thermoproteota archaeon TaxID=2056631 RepID=A0A497F1S9_9CREN|nr:MAG: macro domain-containing protein [Candidatus Verstraetearchaeota archaeon]RLE53594.1 MAG: macro domain-containing protein [Candidatus Verstraetearchaeota archaeon]